MRFLPYLAFFALCFTIQPVQAGSLFSSGKTRAEGDNLYKSAYAAFDNGDYPRAHELLDQAEKLKPNQADGWNLRGAIYLKQRVFDKAETAFSRAAALDPDLWAAQFNYAEVAFRNKAYPVARTRFDRLVSQTNRFKQQNQWELAQYKAFLSSLLMNDEAGAQKRLTKLPQAGGVTPSYAYAQAALAFHRKDALGAQKVVSGAQATYSTTLNNLFAESLASVGWDAPAPMSNAALAAAGPLLPGAYPGAGPGTVSRPAYVIDPKLEAAAAEPLPVADPAASHAPASRALIPVSNTDVRVSPISPVSPVSPSDLLLRQPSVAVRPVAAPTPGQDSALERGTLLD